MRTRVWRVHSSRLPHSQPVLISSWSSWRHVSKSVPSQRKRDCLFIDDSCARTWFLHSCVLRLVHISPKVSTSTRDKNVNQALQKLQMVTTLNIIPSIIDTHLPVAHKCLDSIQYPILIEHLNLSGQFSFGPFPTLENIYPKWVLSTCERDRSLVGSD